MNRSSFGRYQTWIARPEPEKVLWSVLPQTRTREHLKGCDLKSVGLGQVQSPERLSKELLLIYAAPRHELLCRLYHIRLETPLQW